MVPVDTLKLTGARKCGSVLALDALGWLSAGLADIARWRTTSWSRRSGKDSGGGLRQPRGSQAGLPTVRGHMCLHGAGAARSAQASGQFSQVMAIDVQTGMRGVARRTWPTPLQEQVIRACVAELSANLQVAWWPTVNGKPCQKELPGAQRRSQGRGWLASTPGRN